MNSQVHIVGGGLAGSEAAWQLAQAGVQVRLSEMRGGGDMTAAHQSDGLAELVCSNSRKHPIFYHFKTMDYMLQIVCCGSKRGDFDYHCVFNNIPLPECSG